MDFIRVIYKEIFPLKFREAVWFCRSLMSYIFTDRLPQSWVMEDYEDYWKQRLEKGNEAISYPELVEITLSLVKEQQKVLDIGCGSGAFLEALCQKIKIEVTGVDVSHRAVEKVKQKGIAAFVCNAANEDLASMGQFDIVTLYEVIEHIQNPEKLLLNLKRTQPHATILLSIPNTGYIGARLRLLFGRFPKQWIVHPGEHIRFWTLHDFKLLAKSLGFSMVKIIAVSGPQRLARHWPSLFAESLVFVLKVEGKN